MFLEKRSLLKNSTCFTALLIIGIEQAFKYDLDATMDTKKQAEEAMRENEKFLKKIFDSIQDGISVIDINLKVINKDGHLVVLETSGVPVFDKVGNFTGYRGVDRDITDRKRTEDELLQEKKKLETALNEIRRLSGLLPICSSCKKIRDDKGYWNDLEAYIEKHSDALFTHGMCPECSEKLYGKKKWYVKMKKRK